MIWHACEEHVDYLMDDIIDEYHVAPVLEPYSPAFHIEKASCKWCGQEPVYQLIFEPEM
ncbi:CxxH/CxxC protein [Thermoflavimicrobium dichotomicum]|uniref:CxxH/CxxC protein, BA_5709 family n=1 Tax=Thermoflavimicrobium dichotomicum TaxID=46223 RepID=A0A1I3KAA8_9BACL|nr:CxxH/CxxC protein [Thermoflavimicrobium dichotomicum]SFI69413.1 CxxH/CxxC protein, BA_5709 family [Thermoflavimicrobium dichotomicum]